MLSLLLSLHRPFILLPLEGGVTGKKRKPEEEKLRKNFMGNSSKNCNIAKEKEGCALDGCGKEDAPVME